MVKAAAGSGSSRRLPDLQYCAPPTLCLPVLCFNPCAYQAECLEHTPHIRKPFNIRYLLLTRDR